MLSVVLILAIVCVASWYFIPEVRMALGGMLMDIGYWSQDGVSRFDFHRRDPSPNDVWNTFVRLNGLASKVRGRFPRTSHHPLVAIVVCMDGRIDTNEASGDSRRFYYFIRTAGSVIEEKEEEMLELAVSNGVMLIIFTRHTDCAAEKVASDPQLAAQFPVLARAVRERDTRLAEFVHRPKIREAIDAGRLLVKLVDIDTNNEHAFPHRDTGGIITQPEALRQVAN